MVILYIYIHGVLMPFTWYLSVDVIVDIPIKPPFSLRISRLAMFDYRRVYMSCQIWSSYSLHIYIIYICRGVVSPLFWTVSPVAQISHKRMDVFTTYRRLRLEDPDGQEHVWSEVVRSGGDVETIEAYGPKRSLEDGKLGADEREIEDSLHRVSRKSSLGNLFQRSLPRYIHMIKKTILYIIYTYIYILHISHVIYIYINIYIYI